MGITLALLIILQAGSGLLISLVELLPSSWAPSTPLGTAGAAFKEFLEAVHLGGGWWGKVYRLLLGLGILGLACSGSLIFFKIRARTRQP